MQERLSDSSRPSGTAEIDNNVMDDETLHGSSDGDSISSSSDHEESSRDPPAETVLQAEVIEVHESSLAASKPRPYEVAEMIEEGHGALVGADDVDYIVEEEPKGKRQRYTSNNPRSGLSPPGVLEHLHRAAEAAIGDGGVDMPKKKRKLVYRSDDSSSDSDSTTNSLASATRRYNQIAAIYRSDSDSDA